MLSAAKDIISRQSGANFSSSNHNLNHTDCQNTYVDRDCQQLSTGAVLLADILPSFFIKLCVPFFQHRIPFGFRHFLVCACQFISFLIVANSKSIEMSLVGVCFASGGAGLGESCYLALSSHYDKSVISYWSSGTGGAGIIGAFAYATLTEPKLFALQPSQALLMMLIIPVIFALTFVLHIVWESKYFYLFILTPSPTLYRPNLLRPSTWIVPKQKLIAIRRNGNQDVVTVESNTKTPTEGNSSSVDSQTEKYNKMSYVLSLLRYMIPLTIVYYTEYLINQGIVELLVFDCAHGFGLSKSSQYRWYQVLYQIGVFISRSSVNFFELSATALYLLPVLQTMNLLLFFMNAVYSFVPHIAIIFAFILFEGFFGGASYVNTFNKIHKEVPYGVKEFCMSVVSNSDTLGTVAAGFTAFPLHNFICNIAP